MSAALAVLLWLHIVCAVGWLGAAMVFAMLIGPTLPSLSPASRGELVVKLFPKYIRWAEIFTLVTPVTGVALGLYIGPKVVFDPSTSLGMYISAGALLSLVTLAISFGLIAPTARKIVRLTEELMKSPAPPPAALGQASKRLRTLSTSGLVLLFVIVACMALAAS